MRRHRKDVAPPTDAPDEDVHEDWFRIWRVARLLGADTVQVQYDPKCDMPMSISPPAWTVAITVGQITSPIGSGTTLANATLAADTNARRAVARADAIAAEAAQE